MEQGAWSMGLSEIQLTASSRKLVYCGFGIADFGLRKGARHKAVED